MHHQTHRSVRARSARRASRTFAAEDVLITLVVLVLVVFRLLDVIAAQPMRKCAKSIQKKFRRKTHAKISARTLAHARRDWCANHAQKAQTTKCDTIRKCVSRGGSQRIRRVAKNRVWRARVETVEVLEHGDGLKHVRAVVLDLSHWAVEEVKVAQVDARALRDADAVRGGTREQRDAHESARTERRRRARGRRLVARPDSAGAHSARRARARARGRGHARGRTRARGEASECEAQGGARARTSGSSDSSDVKRLPARESLFRLSSPASCRASKQPSVSWLSLSSSVLSSGRVGKPSSDVRPQPLSVSISRLVNLSRPVTFVALHASRMSSVISSGALPSTCEFMALSRSMAGGCGGSRVRRGGGRCARGRVGRQRAAGRASASSSACQSGPPGCPHPTAAAARGSQPPLFRPRENR